MARVSGIRRETVIPKEQSYWYSWLPAPVTGALAFGGTVPTTMRDASGSQATVALGLTNTPHLDRHDGTMVAVITPPFGVEVWEGMRLQNCPFVGSLNQQASNNDADPVSNVARYIFRVSREAGNLGPGAGMLIHLDDDAGLGPPNLFDPATVDIAFGVVGDGAGGWQYYSKPTTLGAPIFTAPLVWPVAITEFATVELRIEGGTLDRTARFRVYINGALALERLWSSGELPFYTAMANGNSLHALIQNQNSVAVDANIFCASIQARFGEVVG